MSEEQPDESEGVTCYTIDTLPKDVRDQLIEEKKTELYEHLEASLVTEDLTEFIQEQGISGSDLDVVWSLSSCQGDGVAFSCTLELEKFCNRHQRRRLFDIRRVLKARGVEFSVTVTQSGHYCHAYTMGVELNVDANRKSHANYPTVDTTPYEDELLKEFEDSTLEEIRRVSKAAETHGYDVIEGMTDDDAALQELQNEDLRYNEDGEEIDDPDEPGEVVDSAA